MDDTVAKYLKNTQNYLKTIKGHEDLLKTLIESNERIAQSLDRIEKMIEQSWVAYRQVLDETEQQVQAPSNQ